MLGSIASAFSQPQPERFTVTLEGGEGSSGSKRFGQALT